MMSVTGVQECGEDWGQLTASQAFLLLATAPHAWPAKAAVFGLSGGQPDTQDICPLCDR